MWFTIIVTILLSVTASAKSPLTQRAFNTVANQLTRIPAPRDYTIEEMQRFYAEGKVVKLYDFGNEIYFHLRQAGVTAKAGDYMQAVLHLEGWVTIDFDSIVYAYPADQPPHKVK